MRHLVVIAAATLALAGCPGDPQNPDVLWLSLDGSEIQVRLVDTEPLPF